MTQSRAKIWSMGDNWNMENLIVLTPAWSSMKEPQKGSRQWSLWISKKTIPPGIYAGFKTSKNEKAYIFGLNTAPEKLLAFRGLLSVSIVFLSRCKLHKGLKAEFGFLWWGRDTLTKSPHHVTMALSKERIEVMQKLYRATAYKAVYSVCLANGVTLLHSISV